MVDSAAWAELVRDIDGFPRHGVVFADITPLLADAVALRGVVDALAAPYATVGVTKVVGIEARGFILAAPVALALGAGFVPVRKAGKLPWQTIQASYELEYGVDILEAHTDAVTPADHVLIVDDVIATGGTAGATIELVERLGATVAGVAVVIELASLDGRRRVGTRPMTSIMVYG